MKIFFLAWVIFGSIAFAQVKGDFLHLRPTGTLPTTCEDNDFRVNSSNKLVQCSSDSWSDVDTTSGDGPVLIQNLAVTASVGSSALTIAVKQSDGSTDCSTGASACKVAVRDETQANGTYDVLSITSSLSLTISSGSTLGGDDATESFIFVYICNSGSSTAVLGAGRRYYNTKKLISTTAEGGAGAADSNAVMYTSSALTSKPCKEVAVMRETQTTAGTWAAVPTSIDLWPFSIPAVTVQYSSDNGGSQTRNAFNAFAWEDRTFDPYNTWTSDTTFTAPWNGIYSYHFSGTMAALSSNTITIMRANMNNSYYFNGDGDEQSSPFGANSATGSVAGTVRMAAGNTLKGEIYFDDSTSDRNKSADGSHNAMTINWVGFYD